MRKCDVNKETSTSQVWQTLSISSSRLQHAYKYSISLSENHWQIAAKNNSPGCIVFKSRRNFMKLIHEDEGRNKIFEIKSNHLEVRKNNFCWNSLNSLYLFDRNCYLTFCIFETWFINFFKWYQSSSFYVFFQCNKLSNYIFKKLEILFSNSK